MLTDEQIKDAADRLYEAERARVQMPALTLSYPDMDMDDAYRVQRCWVDRKVAEGASVYGYK
ncbi:MAG: 2-oxo-hepta-3-ene-1,7-dioic acid hydratase, partial [Halieaceae bacterium]